MDELHPIRYRSGGILWESIIGKKVKFVHDDIKGELYLKDYIKENNKIIITYKNIDFTVQANSILHCRIQNILSSILINDSNKQILPYIDEDYDTIKNLTVCSEKNIKVKCPFCGTLREIVVKDLFRHKKIPCRKCGDGRSYPEKFIYSMLDQLNVDFDCELKKNSNNKEVRYDFYLNDYNLVIEADGMQHFDNKNTWYLGNDEEKTEILKKDGIECIHIDCRYSDMNYIKENILKSKLNTYFNLDLIDFLECHRWACNSLVYIAGNKYDSGITDLDLLSNILHISRKTLRNYLVKAKELGICDFCLDDLKKERSEKCKRAAQKRCSKSVIVMKNGVQCGTFKSVTELCEKSFELFGVRFDNKHVGDVANHRYGRKTHCGYTFEWC